MKICILFCVILAASCSQNPVNNEGGLQTTKNEHTVDADYTDVSDTKIDDDKSLEKQQADEFIPYTVKANKNKTISLFIGKLEDRMFYSIGVIKWLERHGYKITKVLATSSEEDQLLSALNSKKKTSTIEWQLHQCCADNFPLKESNSYKEVLKNFEQKVFLPDYAQDRQGCIDFANENNQDHVLCIIGDKKSKVEIEELDSAMNLIIITLPEVNYSEQLSLVDYIDQGYSLAQKIKK